MILKALLFKTSSPMWCHDIVGADMVIVIVLTIMDLIALGLFLFSSPMHALVL